MKKLLMMIGAAAVSVGAMLPLSAMADAVRVYDVDDYVQRGLITHFDGIRNVGADAAHDLTAVGWTNLVARQPHAEFVGDTGSWAGSGLGYSFKGTVSAYAMISSPGIELGNYATIQLALDATPSDNTAKYTGLFRSLGDSGIVDELTFWSGRSDEVTTITLKDDKYSGGKHRMTLTGWEGQYVTAVLGKANSYIFQGTVPENALARTAIAAVPEASYSFGGSNEDTRWFKGVYHSVRIYNVELTSDELQQNRIVDDARYRNEATKGLLPNVVVVGADGTGANVKYLVMGSETFSAPATIVTVKGAFRRSGYVLETWDGTAWSGAVTNDSGSCEITVASGDAAKRITWLWTDILRSYDVDDYVQDGLVAHFDGIRNAGASAAHATSGTKWTNLGSSGSAYDAALESWDSNPVNGEWTATGYHFNTTDTNTFAAIDTAIDLGTNFTIQLATTFDLDEQATGNAPYRYPSYFNTYDGNNANGMWTDNQNGQGKTLAGCFDNYLGEIKRLYISNWEGQYVTMMLEQTGQAMFFQDDKLPAGSACSITKAPGAKRYTWSGAPKDKKKTPVRGVYHSVRMYTNTLDNAQLQLNRKIDEARFRGNCDVTIVNGAIGETGTNGACSFPDGCYNLGDGESWTLTAESVVVDGCRYQPRLVVEEKVDGEWTQVASIWTESYTLNQASLTNPVRLTWTWEKRIGLTVSFY